ncbi:MAG TPA: hypothetical protein RMH99_00565 [Sandaracinaceae bacterium LLY-WYZ-13_1]|nr:hypothetical protein [Sandaracinaceae bacterium LLY-WYZ-13_1]
MMEHDRDDATEAATTDAAEAEAEEKSALEEMLEDEPPPAVSSVLQPAGATDSLVGEVVDDRHPSLRGRVRVRWQDLEGQTFEKWLPTLQGLPVRVADRVLMLRATNWTEYVITGVVDGFARRPEVERDTKAELELKRDEAIRVRSPEGEDLVEVFQDDRGPVVRFLSDDVDLDLKGELRVSAKAIELEAKQGQARIKASDDVVVVGETIHLN